MATDLLSNAVKHADGATRLSVDHVGGRLRIAVTDPTSTPPSRIRHRPEKAGGHGIFLVDHLARRWGTRPDDPGKTVWSAPPLPPDASR
ncbi:ATP-binding protein [Streptomyces europaeiscabiei]|uniref:ATP-binding protein n=1 Tax=Streptomyces europaeiscabiei TaxID=146819 RepID=UPI0038F792D3